MGRVKRVGGVAVAARVATVARRKWIASGAQLAKGSPWFQRLHRSAEVVGVARIPRTARFA